MICMYICVYTGVRIINVWMYFGVHTEPGVPGPEDRSYKKKTVLFDLRDQASGRRLSLGDDLRHFFEFGSEL